MIKKYYRPEIDGLRALAIIPVVLFHAGVVGFSGGFIGVDIFFVISGFLITSILIREMKGENFSFINFWERRVRRILPALIAVVLISIIASCILLLFPRDLLDFGKSIIAQSFFLSNVFFMRREGYFAAPTEASPLLHTWTLSVEEQFYILFPLLLFFVYTFLKKRLFFVVCVIGLLSFIYSIYLVNALPGDNFAISLIPDIWGGTTNQTAGFYLLPSRAWELLIGALIALTSLSTKSKRVSEILSLLGVSAILYAVTQFDSKTPFPGVYALVPTLGAALIIISNTDVKTFIGRILSSSGLVWIGLISYSLYLWHWPIFVFADVLLVGESWPQVSALILLSIIMAYISYELVETPFRKPNESRSKLTTITIGLSILIVLAGFGYALRYIDTTKRVPLAAEKIVNMEENLGQRYHECYQDRTSKIYKEGGPCIIGLLGEEMSPSFIVWGDSHAGMILPMLDVAAQESGVQGVFFGSGGCIPITNVTLVTPREECGIIQDLALSYMHDHDIKSILLASRWNVYTVPEDNARTNTLIVDVHSKEISTAESQSVFKNNLEEMIATMSREGRHVFILEQVPEHSDFDKRKYFYAAVRSEVHSEYNTISLAKYVNENQFSSTVFNALKKRYQVNIINPSNILCREVEGCLFEHNGNLLYKDRDHLSYFGTKLIKPLFNEFLNSSKEVIPQ